MERLGGEARLEIVPGATHLFEEPSTLEQVAQLARDWFVEHLTPVPEHRGRRSGR
jgi:putative phosphoribosyl transferase